jgi:hypothetical protein
MATVAGIKFEAGVRYAYGAVWSQLHEVAKDEPARPDLQSWFGAPTPPSRDQVWPQETPKLSDARRFAEKASHGIIQSTSQELFGKVQESAFEAVSLACADTTPSTVPLSGVLLYGGLYAGDNSVYNEKLHEFLQTDRYV